MLLTNSRAQSVIYYQIASYICIHQFYYCRIAVAVLLYCCIAARQLFTHSLRPNYIYIYQSCHCRTTISLHCYTTVHQLFTRSLCDLLSITFTSINFITAAPP